MDRAEAIEILENGDWWFALDVQYTIENPEDEKLHEAIDMAIAALREQEQYDTLLKAFHDRLELDGLECDHCKHGGFGCGTCPQTDEFAEHCEFWEWAGLGGEGMKNCANCGNRGSSWCYVCETGNPPNMWCPCEGKEKEDKET